MFPGYILLLACLIKLAKAQTGSSLEDFLLIDGKQPLIIIFEKFILILPEGLRLSPAPEVESAPPGSENSFNLPPKPPVLVLKPSRRPMRKPIRFPPPPPLHLLASTLLSLQEENELAGPPELMPKPPRPPPTPSVSQSLTPVIVGTDAFLPPPPSNRPPLHLGGRYNIFYGF